MAEPKAQSDDSAAANKYFEEYAANVTETSSNNDNSSYSTLVTDDPRAGNLTLEQRGKP